MNARVAALLWECLPLAVYSFLNTTTASIPKLALSSRMGETALGIYGPVTQPVVLLQVGATYLFNPFITVFADSYARRDKKGFFKAVFAVQGIVLALLLDELHFKWFKKISQTIIYIPHFMSWVVVASIFTMFLSPKNGLINGVITALGGDSIYFLANEKWWRPIFYMIAVWKDIGWGTIIYIAALSGVDMEQHEAAVLDGATRFQRVIYLTLPAISGTIVTVFILNLAKVLNLFDPVWVLQNSMVINTSDVLETYVYRMGISGSQYGLSTAAGLFKSVISILLVAIGNKLSKKLTGEEVL